MVPILSTQKVQWAWEIEFSPVGWNTVVLCFSQIRPLVCVGGATEGKRSPQMFCLDTAKKTRFPASDRNIVVAFFVTWRVENGVAVFFLRCRKRIRLGKTPGPAHKISPRVFFPRQLVNLCAKSVLSMNTFLLSSCTITCTCNTTTGLNWPDKEWVPSPCPRGKKYVPSFFIQLKHWNGRTVQLGGSWRSRARACACVLSKSSYFDNFWCFFVTSIIFFCAFLYSQIYENILLFLQFLFL